MKHTNMVTRSNSQVVRSSSLIYAIVGSGQVFEKYWIPAEKANYVKIAGVLSTKTRKDFTNKYPDYSVRYIKVNDYIDSVVSELEIMYKYKKFEVIALLTRSNARIETLTRILKSVPLMDTKVFIEKPFASDIESLNKYRFLTSNYPGRIHYSSKYATGRADILRSTLPKSTLPTKIEVKFIEGYHYYNFVLEQVARKGSHQYLVDGPELDLCFHVIDILTTLGKSLWGKTINYEINECIDPSTSDKRFTKGFVIKANITMHLERDKQIPISLLVGKASMTTDRKIIFTYQKKGVYTQEFLEGNCIDPIYHTCVDHPPRLIHTRPNDYQYYPQELMRNKFTQDFESQLYSIYSNEVVILMQKLRKSTK